MSLVIESSTKLFAYSSQLIVLKFGEISASVDSVAHMERTRDVNRRADYERARVLVFYPILTVPVVSLLMLCPNYSCFARIWTNPRSKYI